MAEARDTGNEVHGLLRYRHPQHDTVVNRRPAHQLMIGLWYVLIHLDILLSFKLLGVG